MSDAELIAAAARVQADWRRAVAGATGGRVWEDDGVPCVAAGGELLILFPPALPEPTLDRTVAWAEEHDVELIGCWTAGDDAAVGRAVAAGGFQEGWRHHWMAADACAADADPRVAAARAIPEWDAYGQALLGMAGARTVPFLARADGELAGFAWLHAPAGETVAGIFDVIVFERFRRRGLGRALTAAACAHAAALDCTHVTLNATGEGELLYTAAGFRSLGHGRTWWRRIR